MIIATPMTTYSAYEQYLRRPRLPDDLKPSCTSTARQIQPRNDNALSRAALLEYELPKPEPAAGGPFEAACRESR
jgi:hypothetical protein